MRVDVRLSDDGQVIEAIAVEPKACALGQAATSIMSGNVVGMTVEDVRAAANIFHDMLKKKGEPPRGKLWELRHLQGVRDYPPRHASTILPFEALLHAINDAETLLSLKELSARLKS